MDYKFVYDGRKVRLLTGELKNTLKKNFDDETFKRIELYFEFIEYEDLKNILFNEMKKKCIQKFI